MDTRIRMLTIIDYENFYGVDRPLDDALELIKDIPSLCLLNYIAVFNIKLYLNDHPEDYAVQKALIQTMTLQAGPETQQQLVDVFKRTAALEQLPVIIWNFSNLAFYDLIFTNYNGDPARVMAAEEIRRLFDAYLILNSITSKRFEIPEAVIQQYVDDDKIELFTVSKFIYQRDYMSTTDLTNQVVRGCMFFDYLENHPLFKTEIFNYYKAIGVKGYLEMFANLLILFTGTEEREGTAGRNHIIDLTESRDLINLHYLQYLSVNTDLSAYKKDISFTCLRNKMLFKASDYKYVILDINFLINAFYKTQVFAVKSFFEQKGIKKDFLSEKAKGFMEDIYFRKLIARCFPSEITHFGDTALTHDGKEFCDGYLRMSNKVLLLELKDVLLNSIIKDSADDNRVIEAIERKFLENEKTAPKGIRQLLNAIDYLESSSLPFDPSLPSGTLDIFPVIVYTDYSFSSDGVNKLLNAIFQAEITKRILQKVRVHPLTIVNLNFFELRENYLASKLLDIFDLIEAYHTHVGQPDYHLATFEVFHKFYMQEKLSPDLGIPKIYSDYIKKIMSAILPPI